MHSIPYLAWKNNGNQDTRLLMQSHWDAKHLASIEQALADFFSDTSAKISPQSTLLIDGSGLTALDISAAWLLITALNHAGYKNIEHYSLIGFHPDHSAILSMAAGLRHTPDEACKSCHPLRHFFLHMGRSSVGIIAGFMTLLEFFGQLCVAAFRTMLQPQRLRLRSTVYHINEVCLRAIPIIALMAFMISMVMGYQGANQLERFGARIFTIDLVAISLLREMGVVITAILVAGRSGSAFAAQIGVMQVNEEIDAMRTIGLDPFELLVIPRVLAIMIALPILTLIADIMGIFGTLFISATVLDISYLQFVERLRSAVSLDTFLIGISKAPVFAVLIGMVGCMQGMQVRNSAAEVGERTTIAVVQSIFLVVLFDAIFSVLFTLAGI